MDDRHQLHESWERTRAHLSRAAALLPASPVESDEGGRVDRYHEWLDHNELELALDELEGIGDNNVVPRAFWGHLRDAAREMGLEHRVLGFDKRRSENAG